MRIHGGERPVQAIPVALSVLLLVHYVWWLAIRLLMSTLWWSSDLQTSNLYVAMLAMSGGVLLAFVVTYPCQAFIGMQMTQNLQDLAAKVRSFRVQEAKCFCCSAGHMTRSGRTIPCDRELIYQSFSAWYSTEDSQETGLDMFNEDVRSQYGHHILETCGGSRMISMSIFIYVVFSTNTPLLISSIPTALTPAEQEASVSQAVLVATRRLVASWGYVFPGMLFYLWANKVAWSHNHRWPRCVKLISPVFVVSLTIGVGFLARSSEYWVADNNWLPLMVWLFLMMAGLCLLDPGCLCKIVLAGRRFKPALDEANHEQPDTFSI